MAEQVKSDLWPTLKNAGMHLVDHGGLETSGYLAYTLLVAAFPFIIFLFSCASLFGGDAAMQSLVHEGLRMVPSQVSKQLWPIIEDVLARPRPGLLTFGIVAAIWAASAGADAIRDGLNRAYDIKESRSWFRRKLSSILAVVAGSIGGLIAAGAMVLLPSLMKWLGWDVTVPDGWLLLVQIGRFGVTGAFLVGVFALVYTLLPAPAAPRYSTFPGAFVAVILWLFLASGFSVYLYYFNNYDNTYGSLGGVIVLLLFLQFSSMVFLFGAEYNAATSPRSEEIPARTVH